MDNLYALYSRVAVSRSLTSFAASLHMGQRGNDVRLGQLQRDPTQLFGPSEYTAIPPGVKRDFEALERRRFETIGLLKKMDLNQSEVARRLHVCRQTVRR